MAATNNSKVISGHNEAFQGNHARTIPSEVLRTRISSRALSREAADDATPSAATGVAIDGDHFARSAWMSSPDCTARTAGDDFNPRVGWMILRLGLCLVVGLACAAVNAPSRRPRYPFRGSASHIQQTARDHARIQQHLADHPELVRNPQERQRDLIQTPQSRIDRGSANVSRSETGDPL